MRVIAGKYRGRKLENFEGMDIRPTSDRVKESLFNILGHKLMGCSFLDLFGGTGSIGIEAVSRGAEKVVFVDTGVKSIKVLRSNLESLKITERVEIYNTDYENALSKMGSANSLFDFIFIDPPYNKQIAQNALGIISDLGILHSEGIIVVEHDVLDSMPDRVGILVKDREKKYGSTMLSMYIYEDNK